MRSQLACFALALLLMACADDHASKRLNPTLDLQGHRGARGLLPENTIPGFIKALELGVTTLELDLVTSRDAKLVVSHEPWFNEDICRSDSTYFNRLIEEQVPFVQLDYQDIAAIDCGSLGNPRFEGQQAMQAYKPQLIDVVSAVNSHCREAEIPFPAYNIEMKTRPEWDNTHTLPPYEFAQLLVARIQELGLEENVTIQSFDPRSLEAVHKLAPELPLVLLVENTDGLAANLARLSFKPHAYSPYYQLVSQELVQQCHEQGIRVVPWTVNELEDMRKLVALGVDGLISDYPDRLGAL